MYGKIELFLRVKCRNLGVVKECAVVKWFASPEYPDSDPLLVRIDTRKPPAVAPQVLYLNAIDPSRVLYEIDRPFMYMMCVEGLDLMGC